MQAINTEQQVFLRVRINLCVHLEHIKRDQVLVKISILHISDLHRDHENPITNEGLLVSLIQDLESAATEDPPIPTPQIVIVSGDIVQGASLDTPNPDELISQQYDQATQFLARLADQLLGGDRKKIVIVPGNHDIDFPKMRQSLEEIDYASVSKDQRALLANEYWKANSEYRWSWSEFKLYKIVDQHLYNSRFDHFRSFYNNFYGSASYPLEPEGQFDIFDFPEYNLTIAGLNSCFQNDPWHRSGAIHSQALSNCCDQMRDRQFQGRLRLAAWHHSTKGSPNEDDYLDADFLQQLINYNYSLGFHGHQHKPEQIQSKFAFGGDKKVNVFSASTLAGGHTALASGDSRGYNIVVLDTDEWKGELHVRTMVNNDFANPIWGVGTLSSPDRSEKFDIQKPPSVNQRLTLTSDLSEAEILLRAGNSTEAAQILEPLSRRDDMAKRLLLTAFDASSNYEGIVRCFSEPQSSEEIIKYLLALEELGETDMLTEVLNRPEVSQDVDPAVVIIRDKLQAKIDA